MRLVVVMLAASIACKGDRDASSGAPSGSTEPVAVAGSGSGAKPVASARRTALETPIGIPSCDSYRGLAKRLEQCAKLDPKEREATLDAIVTSMTAWRASKSDERSRTDTVCEQAQQSLEAMLVKAGC